MNKKGEIPPICKDCKHREGDYCWMEDVDVTTESWLREYDGCNQNTSGIKEY